MSWISNYKPPVQPIKWPKIEGFITIYDSHLEAAEAPLLYVNDGVHTHSLSNYSHHTHDLVSDPAVPSAVPSHTHTIR